MVAPPAALEPVHLREDAAARRWRAARALRVPLVLVKFGTPLLIMGSLAVIVRHPNLAAEPVSVLLTLAASFFFPFLVAIGYPILRAISQEWVLDAAGIHGRGGVRVECPWAEVARWEIAPAERLPSHVRVAFAHGRRSLEMIVPAAERRAIETWFHAAGGQSPH